jgi:hypothetical protein
MLIVTPRAQVIVRPRTAQRSVAAPGNAYARPRMARAVLGEIDMIASEVPPPITALAHRPSSVLPRLINQVVGDLLELVVYSIEELRDRITRSLQ